MEYNWHKDLEMGQEVEKEFAELLGKSKYYTKVWFNESDDINQLRKYDLLAEKIDGTICTFEIKSDFKSETTGNFAFEMVDRMRSSGIWHSEAKYWVIKSGDNFYLFNREALVKHLTANLYKYPEVLVYHEETSVILVNIKELLGEIKHYKI